MKKKYEIEIAKVCDYISLHLNEDLSLDILSKVINLSKYHFHRLFSVQLGINIYSYIQMQRFKKATYQLAFNKDVKIIDIAFDAKFDSPEAFSRAFKKVFNSTPTQFRNNPDWKMWDEKYNFKILTEEKKMEVAIVDFKETQIAVLEHYGSPVLLNNTIPKFIEWRKSSGLSPIGSSRTFGLVYNDPNNTPPKDFHFDVCGEVTSAVPDNDYGVTQKTIPKGRCAVIRHIGSHDTMNDKVYYLYRDWLHQGGYEVRDFPLFFQYLNFFPEVSESELITDIFLPIK